MSEEFISRSAALAAIFARIIRYPIDSSIRPAYEDALEAIGCLPAADVAPVVHGQWVHSRYENCSERLGLVKCSQCDLEAYAIAHYVRGGNYCPNCGARMDGAEERRKDE